MPAHDLRCRYAVSTDWTEATTAAESQAAHGRFRLLGKSSSTSRVIRRQATCHAHGRGGLARAGNAGKGAKFVKSATVRTVPDLCVSFGTTTQARPTAVTRPGGDSCAEVRISEARPTLRLATFGTRDLSCPEASDGTVAADAEAGCEGAWLFALGLTASSVSAGVHKAWEAGKPGRASFGQGTEEPDENTAASVATGISSVTTVACAAALLTPSSGCAKVGSTAGTCYPTMALGHF